MTADTSLEDLYPFLHGRKQGAAEAAKESEEP